MINHHLLKMFRDFPRCFEIFLDFFGNRLIWVRVGPSRIGVSTIFWGWKGVWVLEVTFDGWGWNNGVGVWREKDWVWGLSKPFSSLADAWQLQLHFSRGDLFAGEPASDPSDGWALFSMSLNLMKPLVLSILPSRAFFVMGPPKSRTCDFPFDLDFGDFSLRFGKSKLILCPLMSTARLAKAPTVPLTSSPLRFPLFECWKYELSSARTGILAKKILSSLSRPVSSGNSPDS